MKSLGSEGVEIRCAAFDMALLRFILYEYIKFLTYAVQSHLNIVLALPDYLGTFGDGTLLIIK